MSRLIKKSLDNFIVFMQQNKEKLNTTNAAEMAHILYDLRYKDKYNLGFYDNLFSSRTLNFIHSESGVLHLNFEINCFNKTYIVKPQLLETYYFSRRPELSFLRMEYKDLEPSGVYDYRRNIPPSEEYIKYQGDNLPLYRLNNGSNPKECTFAGGAQIIVRELRDGTFLIIPAGNPLNTIRLENVRNNITLFGKYSDLLQRLQEEYG
ncbi:hypothetical protein HYU21_05000 [Candidatus Woesearchaeota archaeon]|nr:hypothetical protein [Candidatus Woesearchaeota archaeon]